VSHDLARLVTIRALRKDRAERELRRERDALRQAHAKVEAERLALGCIEQRSTAQQRRLSSGDRTAADALVTLNYVVAQRLEAKQVRLRMHRATAESQQVGVRVDAANEVWRQRARAHEALKQQDQTLTRRCEIAHAALVEESAADEFNDGWTARSMAARGVARRDA
jgi:hypothetical protein